MSEEECITKRFPREYTAGFLVESYFFKQSGAKIRNWAIVFSTKRALHYIRLLKDSNEIDIKISKVTARWTGHYDPVFEYFPR